MDDDEQKIIINCQRGGLEEFTFLYDKYIRKIYNFIYYRTYHKETAEDLTSQTFIKALENIAKFKSEKGSFSAWLYRIARNTLFDYYRTKKGTAEINDAWQIVFENDIEYDLDIKEKMKQVKKYLIGLSAEQREIVLMRVWDGLSHKEIASVLGKSEAGCKMSFSRTLAKLRQEIPLALLYLSLIYHLN